MHFSPAVLVFLYVPMAATGYFQLGLLADNDGGMQNTKSNTWKTLKLHCCQVLPVFCVIATSNLWWRFFSWSIWYLPTPCSSTPRTNFSRPWWGYRPPSTGRGSCSAPASWSSSSSSPSLSQASAPFFSSSVPYLWHAWPLYFLLYFIWGWWIQIARRAMESKFV